MDTYPVDVPEDAQQAGDTTTVDVGVVEVYDDHSTWELSGETELENAEIDLLYYRDGEELDNESYTGSSFSTTLDADDWEEPHEVYVVVTGEVPEPESYDYENGQSFDGLVLTGTSQGGDEFDVGSWTLEHYTADSQEARTAIEDARQVIDDADGDVSGAESTWDDAVAAYDEGNFDEAVSLAEEAESQAQSDSGSADQDDGTDGADDGSTDDGASDDGTTADATDDGTTDDASDDAAADDGEDEDEEDDGGIAFTTVLLYVVGLAVLVGLGGGLFYLSQQGKGPNRDPLGK